jgi:stalled ribosome alternative rescue factor ArfA
MRIKPINPVAKAVAHSRRRASVVPPKKGKGSYNRKQTKEQTNAEQNNNK